MPPKSPSLDKLYIQLDKNIKLVEAHAEIRGVSSLIKYCRLKPQEYIFGKHTQGKRTRLFKWWIDEWGNSLLMDKEKRLSIFHNDLRLDRRKIVSTDLYYGLSLDRVAKMSKLVHLVAGKDEDLYQECYLLTFLGLDNYLRSYLYWYGEWQQVSPLLMGLESLFLLEDHKDTRYYHQVGKKENNAIPCVDGVSWLSFLMPAPEGFLKMIRKQYEILLPIFEEKRSWSLVKMNGI